MVSSVLRLSNGELVVVNPGVFDSVTTQQINDLGKVNGIFIPGFQEYTPSTLEFVEQTWPQAQRLGVSMIPPVTAASSSPSTIVGQVTSNVEQLERECNGELMGIRTNGVLLDNLAVHKATGTMFGLPHLSTRRSPNQGDYSSLVDFSMGLYRGASFSSPLDPPSHLWFTLADPLAFRSSILALIDQQVVCQRIIPAQGDVLPAGDEGTKLLMQSYGWILVPEGIDYCLSPIDQVFMQLAWVSQHRLWPVVWKMARNFLYQIFQRPNR